MSFMISLIIVALVRLSVTLILRNFAINELYIDLIVDFVLALIFSILNYNYSSRKNAWKDIQFHKRVALVFSIFVIYTCLTGLYYVIS